MSLNIPQGQHIQYEKNILKRRGGEELKLQIFTFNLPLKWKFSDFTHS